jgi:hypothetical protein
MPMASLMKNNAASQQLEQWQCPDGRIYLRILISLREACEAYLARDVMDLV